MAASPSSAPATCICSSSSLFACAGLICYWENARSCGRPSDAMAESDRGNRCGCRSACQHKICQGRRATRTNSPAHPEDPLVRSSDVRALGVGIGARRGRSGEWASIDSWMFWTSSVAWTAGRSNVAWTAAAEDAFGRWDWGCARTVGRVAWMPVFRLYKSSTSPWRTVGRWDWVSAQSVGRVASCSAWDAGRRASRL